MEWENKKVNFVVQTVWESAKICVIFLSFFQLFPWQVLEAKRPNKKKTIQPQYHPK